MGNSYGNIRSPRMCFNGAKFWQLGWYPNHRISLNPARDGPWRGSLVGFVDVASVPANDPNTVVLVQVADLYLLQNRKISFNSDSVGHGNQVTVARAPSLSGKSDLLEGLRPSVPIITVGDYDHLCQSSLWMLPWMDLCAHWSLRFVSELSQISSHTS